MIPSPIHWHVEPRWLDCLPRLDESLRDGRAETIKCGLFRTVYRVRAGGFDFHVKHCRPAGLRAWLREWVRPVKALLEFRKIVAVAARNVPTLEPVAWGRSGRVGPGDSFLVTRSLVDTTSLGHFLTAVLPDLPEPRRTQSRQRLAHALGNFLAELHSAGVLHPDLHPGNLLLAWDGNRPRLTLIDLHDAEVRGSLSERERLRNLIPFNRWFVLRAHRTDRLRFWHAYSEALGQDRSKGPVVEEATWLSNLHFWRGREGRCLGSNRYFQRLRVGGIVGHVVRDLNVAQLDELIAEPDAPFGRPAFPLLKDSRSATVAEFESDIAGTARRVILKRFLATSFWDGPVACVRRTAAIRSWMNGHAFRDGLLPTPRPLAVWHRRRIGLKWQGYLLTEKVNDAVNLHVFLAAVATLGPTVRAPLLRSRIDTLALTIRNMHAHGWSHRDLKASNLLVDRDGRVWFIDLVGARRPWRLTHARCARDLARLAASFFDSQHLSKSDRLRFLRTYMTWGLYGRANWKDWWKCIAREVERKRCRNQRTGRPLA